MLESIKKITFDIEDINPEKAEEYLLSNTFNRPYKDYRAKRIALAMSSGKWRITHQGIAFDEAGTLLDGQTRLNAIRLSGKTVPIVVCRGLPIKQSEEYTISAIDGIEPRRVADQLGLEKVENPSKVSSAIKGIPLILFRKGANISIDQARVIFNIYGKDIQYVINMTATKNSFSKSFIYSMGALIHHAYPEKFEEFFAKLISGNDLSSNSPIYQFREQMIDGLDNCGTENVRDNRARMARAFQLFLEDKVIDGTVRKSKKSVEDIVKVQSEEDISEIRAAFGFKLQE